MLETTFWKIFGAISAIGIFLMIALPIIHAEEYEPTVINGYYYLDELEIYGIITEPEPRVCAFEIDDYLMPKGTNDYLMEVSQRAVNNWEKAMGDYTNEPENWSMQFTTIPINEQYDEIKLDEQCEIIIRFIPEYNQEVWEGTGFTEFDALAMTENYGQVADMWVIYRDVVFEEETYEEYINGEWITFIEQVPSYYTKQVPEYIEETITHEFGHTFSLDHKPVVWDNFNEKNGIMYSESIMGDPSELPDWYLDEVRYEITEYDIKSMINLYGTNGFIPDGELGFSNKIFQEDKIEKITIPKEEPSLLQKTLKLNIEKFPERFPFSYILYLESEGLLI